MATESAAKSSPRGRPKIDDSERVSRVLLLWLGTEKFEGYSLDRAIRAFVTREKVIVPEPKQVRERLHEATRYFAPLALLELAISAAEASGFEVPKWARDKFAIEQARLREWEAVRERDWLAEPGLIPEPTRQKLMELERGVRAFDERFRAWRAALESNPIVKASRAFESLQETEGYYADRRRMWDFQKAINDVLPDDTRISVVEMIYKLVRVMAREAVERDRRRFVPGP